MGSRCLLKITQQGVEVAAYLCIISHGPSPTPTITIDRGKLEARTMARTVSASLLTCIESSTLASVGKRKADSVARIVDLPISNEHQNVVGFIFTDDFDGLVDDGSEVCGPAELNTCSCISAPALRPRSYRLAEFNLGRFLGILTAPLRAHYTVCQGRKGSKTCRL